MCFRRLGLQTSLADWSQSQVEGLSLSSPAAGLALCFDVAVVQVEGAGGASALPPRRIGTLLRVRPPELRFVQLS